MIHCQKLPGFHVSVNNLVEPVINLLDFLTSFSRLFWVLLSEITFVLLIQGG